MTFEGPGPFATQPRGFPGAIRSSPGGPRGSGSSTLGLQTFASRPRARPIYDAAGIHAPACFLCFVDFPCFLCPRQGARCETYVFRKLLFGLRETYTFGAPGGPSGAPGGFPATPGLAGRPLGDLLAAPGGFRAPPGGSLAASGGLLATPGASGFLWASPWRLPTVPWLLPAPKGLPPDGTWVPWRLTRTGGSPLSIVVSILVCCLEYVVSFMAEFHEV